MADQCGVIMPHGTLSFNAQWLLMQPYQGLEYIYGIGEFRQLNKQIVDRVLNSLARQTWYDCMNSGLSQL